MTGTNALNAAPQPNAIFGSPGTGRNSATAKRRQTPDTPSAQGAMSACPNPCTDAPLSAFSARRAPACMSGTSLSRCTGRTAATATSTCAAPLRSPNVLLTRICGWRL